MNFKNFTVQKVLILSYRIFLGLTVLGLLLASFNFGYGPISEKPEPLVDISSMNWTEIGFDSEEYYMHRDYVKKTENYGTYELVPSFYVILPCGVGMLFAGVFVMVDIFLKDIVETTVGLYNSFGLLSMVLGFTVTYQLRATDIPNGFEKFMLSYEWVTAFHSLLLILLILQIILSVWELRRRNIRWPTVHFSHFCTIGVLAKIILAFFSQQLALGFLSDTVSGVRNGYGSPVDRYPEYFFMPCSVACLYGVLVTFETITSQLFGHVHDKMTGISGLIMSAGYAVMGIICIPSIAMQFMASYQSMIFTWVSFGVSLIYAVLCLVVPKVLNTPPAIIRYLAYGMARMKCCGGSLWKNLKASDTLRTNMILLIPSFLCIVLISVGWTYDASYVIMLCSDIAIFYRALPAVVSELSTCISPVVQPLQVICLYVLETIPLFIGLIYNYFVVDSNVVLVANILNIIIIIFQLYKVQTNPAVKAEISAMLEAKNSERREVQPSDEEQPLHGVGPNAEEGNGDTSVPSA